MWKTIEDFPNYTISESGQIKNKRTGKILKGTKNGYVEVTLYCDKKRFTRRVHILVAKEFIANADPENQTIVNHIDGNKLNNHMSNLEWVTPSRSYEHAIEKGLITRYTRSVYKIDGEGKIVKEYPSVISASKDNDTSATSISSVCRGRGVTASGFYWCYVDKYSEFKIIKRGEKNRKPVYQIDKNTGETIKEWPSLREAADSTGIFYNNIIHACKKETRTCGGYKWRYVPQMKGKEERTEIDGWVAIKNFPNYKISRDGKIYSIPRKQLRKLSTNNGYKMIELRNGGDKMSKGVHVLVAETYISNPENKKYVNHINGNRSDNRVSNLEWTTKREDVLHAIHVLGKGKKTVEQLNMEGGVIAVFDSIKTAHEQTGAPYTGISKVCCGVSKTSGGYKWRFVE